MSRSGYNSMAAWQNSAYFEHPKHAQSQTPPRTPLSLPESSLGSKRRKSSDWNSSISILSIKNCSAIQQNSTPLSPTSPVDSVPTFGQATLTWSPPQTPPISPGATSSPPSLPTTPNTVLNARHDRSLSSQLFAASIAGDLTQIHYLLSLGAPVDQPALVQNLYTSFKPAKPGYLTPLAGAATHHQLAAVQLLLSCGAQIDPSIRQSSSSPLHQACKVDDVETVTYLLEAGAEINRRNCFNVTPLMYAVKYGSWGLVDLLLSYSPELAARDFIQTTVVHWAVWRRDAAVMRSLLQAGANADSKMADRSRPLHLAASCGYEEVINVLLECGAEPRKKDGEGRRAVELARTNGFEALAKRLEEACR